MKNQSPYSENRLHSEEATNKQGNALGPSLILLAVVCFFLYFFQIGSYPFFDVDEPRYAEAAREMLESGNWITPYFNYELRFDKPVLFYWLIALSYKVFGVSEFAARLVSALSAAAMVFMTFFFGRTWVSNRFGLMSALILATCIQMIGLSKMSITDMNLSALMCATTMTLFWVCHRSTKFWLLAGIFSGLAILCKGPVGMVIPGGVLILYSFFTKNMKRCFFNIWFPLGILTALSVAFPWYWAAYQENGQVFLDMLVFHNVTRFNGTVSGHYQPFYFYFIVLFAGFLPWSMYLPSAIMDWWKNSKKKLSAPFNESRLDHVGLFGIIWTLLIFVFFTVSKTKLLTYILPLFPGLALFMGTSWYKASLNPKSWLSNAFAKTSTALLVLSIIAGILLIVSMGVFLPVEAKHISGNYWNIVVVVLTVSGIGLTMVNLKNHRLVSALNTKVLTITVVNIIFMLGILPMVNHTFQGDILSYEKMVGDNPLITYEITRPSLTYYSQKKVETFSYRNPESLDKLLDKYGNSFYVITKNKLINSLKEMSEERATVEMVKKGARYSLLSLQGLAIMAKKPRLKTIHLIP